MSFKETSKKIWSFLKEDSWSSWFVSLILMIIGIKYILFPLLTLATGTPLPLVIVESCSMYHSQSFDSWWTANADWYTSRNISKEEFQSFWLKSGLNKGDIILVLGKQEYKPGDIIIFNAGARYPIIHRIISDSPIATKGDHNSGQLSIEQNIEKENILGKAALRIPYLGWTKLIFFEPSKAPSERGFCS